MNQSPSLRSLQDENRALVKLFEEIAFHVVQRNHLSLKRFNTLVLKHLGTTLNTARVRRALLDRLLHSARRK